MSICLVKHGPITETFIRAHAERLPATIVQDWPPVIGEKSHPYLAFSRRLIGRVDRMLRNRSYQEQATQLYLRVLKRLSPEAVLAEYGTTGALIMDACRQLNIPLIVHFHGYDASDHRVLDSYRTRYAALWKYAEAIIAVSHEMRERLISLGADRKKVIYNPYGVDCAEFSGANPQTAPPTLLHVGRFVEKKAPHLTLRAFTLAHKAYPQAHLRMIGDGPLLSECRKLASDLKIAHAVTFLGHQPPSVVQAEMRRARAFVQHSVRARSGDSEGTPVAILEASASGLPIISTRHAGIPEIVVEGQTGYLVDEGDVTAMAAHMVRLLEDPGLAQALGRAARRRAIEFYSIARSIERLREIIADASRRSL
jgi:glycosyltransferase involved in cell wall biosynthesis